MRAVEKLPPETLKRLNEDSLYKERLVEGSATWSSTHFQYWPDIDRHEIQHQLKKLDEGQKKFDWVINRLKEDAQFVERTFPFAEYFGGAEEWKYSYTRRLFALETIQEVALKDAYEMDRLKARLKEIKDTRDATMLEYVNMVVLRYARVTKIHPKNLKLSATCGPRTYLMNFIIEMVNPVLGYGKDENPNLPRRIHDNFWTKLKPNYMQLGALPDIFEN